MYLCGFGREFGFERPCPGSSPNNDRQHTDEGRCRADVVYTVCDLSHSSEVTFRLKGYPGVYATTAENRGKTSQDIDRKCEVT
ncbi:hypothetical protein RUM43_009084 [Polyplax serrata]|uniref:Uncharacterized protein n=1 Tax=Polyplax serrata TaxID=468196 RepID=A0AAN8NVF0_POLSC